MRPLCFLALVFLGCGTSADVEGQLTITQGLYGQLTQRCDGAGCLGAPKVGTPVAWFDTNPYGASDAGVKPTPKLETTTKANGFYELALDSGARGYLAVGEDRTNGVQWFTATSAFVPRGLGRLDWHAGPGNDGTWTDVK